MKSSVSVKKIKDCYNDGFVYNIWVLTPLDGKDFSKRNLCITEEEAKRLQKELNKVLGDDKQ